MLMLPTFAAMPRANNDALVDKVHHTDLLTLCAAMAPQSVDMILCDLPYGTTECAWDGVIPLKQMWDAFERLITPCGAIALTAVQPFTSALVMSNARRFRHEWIWLKNTPTNFMNAKAAPLKMHESILVFSLARGNGNQFTDERIRYFPQGVTEINQSAKGKGKATTLNHARSNLAGTYTQTHIGYPRSALAVDCERGLHPTQKPVALFEYLIRTYTQPGELVFDPTCGSGTTAVAARQIGRHFICGDTSLEYVEIARKRLAQPYTPNMFETLAQENAA